MSTSRLQSFVGMQPKEAHCMQTLREMTAIFYTWNGKVIWIFKEKRRGTNQTKTDNGLLQAILYDKGKILDDLAQVTVNLRNVTEKIIEGEGSLGTIINDPNLYDNLNRLLGDANRSFILRTLIRCRI
jgi:hypothetical protein